jgi:hypothetical protein
MNYHWIVPYNVYNFSMDRLSKIEVIGQLLFISQMSNILALWRERVTFDEMIMMSSLH